MTLSLDRIGSDRIEIESVGADPRRLARALMKQLPDLDDRVPIHDVALALDIVSIEVVDLVSIEACLQCDRRKSEGQILVNVGSSPRRQRFSIAHELGHFLNERHEPTGSAGFDCTARDMSSPIRNGRHFHQEREANTFAIEILTPRRLLKPHFVGRPDLARALDMATRFDISRAAAARRYVDLHDASLAVVFSKNNKILYIDQSENFPATTQWRGAQMGPHPVRPTDGGPLSEMQEIYAGAWLTRPEAHGLSGQTLYQQDMRATTLLLAESIDHHTDWEPRFHKTRGNR